MSATLIYDGSCPMCCAARDWIARNAVPGAFEFVACQSEERAKRFPQISEERCMTAMQLVFDDGRTCAGDAALPHICMGLRKWRWAARVLRVPPLSFLSPIAYRFIAKRRQMFSLIVARKAPDSCPIAPRQ
jgi:predicted DCC family thiol-disulfide oxidoreductase YuxK